MNSQEKEPERSLHMVWAGGGCLGGMCMFEEESNTICSG